jgi:hypothetical protein
MLANVDGIGGAIPPGGMHVSQFHDATTDTRHGLRVLWADSRRWQGSRPALERLDRPDLSDPRFGGPLARRLALEGFDEVPGRPDVGRRGNSRPRLTGSSRKRQKKISSFRGGVGRTTIVRPGRVCSL